MANRELLRQCLQDFNFKKLLLELGWDPCQLRPLQIPLDGQTYTLNAVAEKRGLAVWVCDPDSAGNIPEYHLRKRLDHQVAKSTYEHLIVFINARQDTQTWQWVRREPGKPTATRETSYHLGQSGELLLQKLGALEFKIEDEEQTDLWGVVIATRNTFDLEKVTKKFYDRFKSEHAAFLKFLDGIPEDDMERWYVSVMLNRLMFIYFIQYKGFLDNDKHYLKNKLAYCKAELGKDHFYRDFLCPLFFEGFAKTKADRSTKVNKLLGEVPYLNGGIFQAHQIEQLYGKKIAIPDKAFEKLFAFFDEFQWRLDERPLKDDKEINPDVLGYIFEKYINQKQMGAYYTKEDITGYIGKNTIIPFLFDAAKAKCKVAFEGDHSIWNILQKEPDEYIYKAVRHGITWDYNSKHKNEGQPLAAPLPLPPNIELGVDPNKPDLFDRRKNWNKPAPAEFALPTEIWREVVARRQRYQEIKGKMERGEIQSINDLITYNLDIRQFAQDVIEDSEGPDLVNAFWNAIEKVTVLDPTCGSGAFLFAALNILEPLYEACLTRMRFFLDEWGEAGKKNHPNYHKHFSQVLKRVEDHNLKYFIFKTIIVNNLYGVDIMEEAVEICKLRLFLKLVAQIETVNDVEPLPDIDFNIRAGNTLVGFASLDEVKKTQENKLGFVQDEMARIEDEAKIADLAFQQFRRQQTELGGTVTAQDKEKLRERLDKLANELDRYLAGEYKIDPDKRKDSYAKWQISHQPFHWFAEFYGILKAGGFDVIIGNPPWAEYSTVKKTYTVLNYENERSGNLHALCTERSLKLRSPRGSFSFIVQLPLASSSRMETARSVLRKGSETLYVLPFDDRPGKLFEALQHCRSVIFISRRALETKNARLFVNRYQRWASEVREILFQGFTFTELQAPLLFDGHFPKISSIVHQTVFHKIGLHSKHTVAISLSKLPSKNFIFYQEATGYWVKAVVGLPYYAKNSKKSAPAHGRFLYFRDTEMSYREMALLNSSIFYTYFITYGDCFHLTDTLVTTFPIPLAVLDDPSIVTLARKLDKNLRANAERMTINTKDDDKITYDEFFAWKSKPILDEIDHILAKHYGFTDEELDFIINYDIKYRMGSSGAEEAEDE